MKIVLWKNLRMFKTKFLNKKQVKFFQELLYGPSKKKSDNKGNFIFNLFEIELRNCMTICVLNKNKFIFHTLNMFNHSWFYMFFVNKLNVNEFLRVLIFSFWLTKFFGNKKFFNYIYSLTGEKRKLTWRMRNSLTERTRNWRRG